MERIGVLFAISVGNSSNSVGVSLCCCVFVDFPSGATAASPVPLAVVLN